MKNFLLALLAILFPWVIFLIKDRPGSACIAIVLQATLFGWLPMSLWALTVIYQKPPPNTQSTPNTKKTSGTNIK